MNRIMATALFLATALLQASSATALQPVCPGFLPQNNLHFYEAAQNDMTEEQFNEAIDEVMEHYEPVFKEFGAQVVVNRRWTDATVNASASQSGNTWYINMYGGLARREEVTKEGFQLVICHELGHHLAGYPFYNGSWAGSEGQSDYWATQVCAKKVWAGAVQTKAKSELATKKCNARYETREERAVCYKTADGSESLALLLSKLNRGGVPKYETPSKAVVTRTYESHPEGQCRLDTYLAGFLCGKAWQDNYIPGKLDTGMGYNNKASQDLAYKFSCGDGEAVRPKCWFKEISSQAR